MHNAMSREGLISIIVPVYNAERYLERCIDSLTGQSYNKIEIIAVNDGSTDSSPVILERLAKADARIRIISQENQGLSGARNTGLRTANGEYVLFVDSDDWIDRTTCETAVSKMNETEADIVLWGYRREYASSSKANCFFGNAEIVWKDGTEKELWRRMIGPIGEEMYKPETVDSMITAWGKLYKKSALENICFTDTKIIGTEDALFNIQVFAGIQRAVYLPRTFSHYRKEDINTLSHLYNREKYIRWKELYRRIRNVLDEQQVSEVYYTALNNRVCLGLIGLGLNLAEDSRMRFFEKRKELHQILSEAHYRVALEKLDLTFFPFYWRVFFSFARANASTCLVVLLSVMNRLRGL